MAEATRKPAKRKLPAGEGADRPVVKNGWKIYAHPLLLDQIERLASGAAEKGAGSDPAKVLAWVVQAMFDDVPADPTRAAYRQGRSLGPGNKHWFRDRYAGRFRLFFRYDSNSKIIIYAWVNDENTLRTRGAKNDAYAVFRTMLSNGNPPTEWADLLKAASAPDAVKKIKARQR